MHLDMFLSRYDISSIKTMRMEMFICIKSILRDTSLS